MIIIVQLPAPEEIQFNQSEGYSFNITENNHQGLIIGQVSLQSLSEHFQPYVHFSSRNASFNVNATTGEVRIFTIFDYEQQQNYSFEIDARLYVGGRKPQPLDIQTSVNVTVFISDLNDNPPMFTNLPLTLTHMENRTSEELLYHILAHDADSGINQQLEFVIVNVTAHDNFRIDNSTGELYIAASLDREQQENYFITILVHDLGIPQQNMTQTVMITLTDINDNAPILSLDADDTEVGNQSLIITDAAAVGTVLTNVSAIDVDKGNNANVSFEVEGITPFGIRLIGSDYPYTFGELVIVDTSLLAVGLYNITIRAADMGQIPHAQQSSISVSIKVVPAVIFFTVSVYEFILVENSPQNTVIGNVSVEQRLPSPNRLLYSIIEGNEEGFFEINQRTGLITALQMIDREVNSRFNLTISASLPAELPLEQATATATVVIDVEDVNDNTPMFNETSYTEMLLTTDITTVPMKLLQVFVYDADFGSNADLSLSIDVVSPHEYDNYFYVIDDGGIYVNTSTLNQSTYQLNVTVEDGGTPSLQSSILVTIIVQFPVPHVLEFTQPNGYVISITENSSLGIIGRVQLQPYSFYVDQYIRFQGGSVDFSVDVTTGHIEAVNTFDYEEEQRYVFQVSAHLNISSRIPPLYSESYVNVTVEITDVNDNSPEFANLPKNLSILENITSQEPFYHVTAMDADSGINEQLQFEILNVDLQDRFRIDSSTGELYIASQLDREERDSYLLPIRVRDRGFPSMEATSSLNIMLIDVNDNAPILLVHVGGLESNSMVTIMIDNSTEPGTIIANVSAIDQDIGNNAEVDLEVPDEVPFVVHTSIIENNYTLGVISVANVSLIPGNFTFLLTAADRGEPPLISAVEITVMVKYELPEFISFPAQGYEFTVSENSSINTFVGNVSVEQVTPALDGLVYSIVEGNSFFTINPSTGAIVTQQVLDRETQSEFNITVMAFLPSEPSLEPVTVTFIVVVMDINDNVPIFSNQSYFVSILTSETSTNISILQVEATDLDSGSNAQLSYMVEVTLPQYVEQPFVISSDGQIFTTDSLNATTYILNVTVKDNGIPSMKSSVSVSLLVQLPVPESVQFTQPKGYTFNISETKPSASFVGQVSLEPLPSHVQEYIIYSGNSERFLVLQTTGGIRTLDSFDYEETQKYQFEVSVRIVIPTRVPPVDIGASVNVTVLIVDENDNPPLFTNLPANIFIMENQTTGNIVYNINATDLDTGVNQELEYEILNLDLEGKFSINISTGELYAYPGLDREEQERYVVFVRVSDLGTPRMSAIETIEIILIDINDNAPAFIEPNMMML